MTAQREFWHRALWTKRKYKNGLRETGCQYNWTLLFSKRQLPTAALTSPRPRPHNIGLCLRCREALANFGDHDDHDVCIRDRSFVFCSDFVTSVLRMCKDYYYHPQYFFISTVFFYFGFSTWL